MPCAPNALPGPSTFLVLLAQTIPLGSAELSLHGGPFFLLNPAVGRRLALCSRPLVYFCNYTFKCLLSTYYVPNRDEWVQHVETVPSLCTGSSELTRWTEGTEGTVEGWDTRLRGRSGAGTLCEQDSTRDPGSGRTTWGAMGTCAFVSPRLLSWPWEGRSHSLHPGAHAD